MRVMLDTNVVLDALLDREPWGQPASTLWEAAHLGTITCCVTTSALTDIYYIARGHIRRNQLSHVGARQVVRMVLDDLDVLQVDGDDLERAFAKPGGDFEDNLQIACAERELLSAIVSRDPSGFSHSSVPIYSSSGFVRHLIEMGMIADAGPSSPPESDRPLESGQG